MKRKQGGCRTLAVAVRAHPVTRLADVRIHRVARTREGQGKNAPGGAYSYMVKGKMIGGFALVAYPAQYASSGIMTFMVNHDGVVYQKDLGGKSGKKAQAMKLFNPDSTWKKVVDKDLKAENL